MKLKTVIGLAQSTEVELGICKDVITEKSVRAEVKSYRLLNENTKMLDETILKIKMELLATKSMLDSYRLIRYIVFRNLKYEVAEVELNEKRIILTIGGLYHE